MNTCQWCTGIASCSGGWRKQPVEGTSGNVPLILPCSAGSQPLTLTQRKCCWLGHTGPLWSHHYELIHQEKSRSAPDILSCEERSHSQQTSRKRTPRSCLLTLRWINATLRSITTIVYRLQLHDELISALWKSDRAWGEVTDRSDAHFSGSWMMRRWVRSAHSTADPRSWETIMWKEEYDVHFDFLLNLLWVLHVLTPEVVEGFASNGWEH